MAARAGAVRTADYRLAGAAIGKLGATYLLLFGAMLDLGIVQNPMLGSGEPPAWEILLPGYGPGRVIVDAAFSEHFHAWGALGIALWGLALAVAVLFLLGRLVAIDGTHRGVGGNPSPLVGRGAPGHRHPN